MSDLYVATGGGGLPQYVCSVTTEYHRARSEGRDGYDNPDHAFAVLETVVVRVLRKHLVAILKRYPAHIRSQWGEAPLIQREVLPDTAAFTKRLEAIPEERMGYLRLASKGLMDDDTLACLLKELHDQAMRLRADIELSKSPRPRRSLDPRHALRILQTLDDPASTSVKKRDVIVSCVENIILSADRHKIDVIPK